MTYAVLETGWIFRAVETTSGLRWGTPRKVWRQCVAHFPNPSPIYMYSQNLKFNDLQAFINDFLQFSTVLKQGSKIIFLVQFLFQ